MPRMAEAAGKTRRDHAEHALQTIVDLMDAAEEETVTIDRAVPPAFEEWRLKGVKKAWFAESAPTERHCGRPMSG